MVKRSAERIQFLHDVMITALEGGVGYWSEAADIVRSDNDDLWYESYVLFERQDESEGCSINGNEELDHCIGHVVTPDTIAKGIGVLKEWKNWRFAEELRDANKENDCGYLDADSCDCIVQAGIFGDIVYG